MAIQYRRVTQQKRNPYAADAMLQAKIAALPAALRAKQQRAALVREKKYQDRTHKLNKRNLAFQKDQERRAMGLEASKLGLNLAMSDSGTSLGDMGTGISKGVKSIFGGNKTTPAVSPDSVKTPGVISSIKPQTVIGSGMAGYGLGKMMGGKSKKKKALYGAAGGALLSALGSKGDIGSTIGGGLAGGLASYFL